MATLLTAFNNLVINFCDDLIYIFPEENDFKVYKRGISMLNSMNAKKVCVLFRAYSSIYKEQIVNKDEKFFLDNNYNTIVNDYNNVYDDNTSIELIINKLKHYWEKLSDTNKYKIWEYLNSLLKLCDMIA